jgi:hypothetical protein
VLAVGRRHTALIIPGKPLGNSPKEPYGFFCTDMTKPHPILDIENRVADVIGCLDEKCERMTGPYGLFLDLYQPDVPSKGGHERILALAEPMLLPHDIALLAKILSCSTRVLDECRQGCRGELQPFVFFLLQAHQDSEPLSISLERLEIHSLPG